VPVADPNGFNNYRRPVVILTRNDEIEDADTLYGVVASNTAATSQPPSDSLIQLPYQREGRVGTKLKKPTVAVCGWIVAIDKSEIAEEDIGGVVPSHLVQLILERRAEIDRAADGS
jgi:hypothetical protein